MNLAEIIKKACKDTKVSVSELARRTGQSPQNLGKKINKGTIKFDEFMELIDALDVRFEYTVLLPDESAYENPSQRYIEKVAKLEAQVEYEKKNNQYLLGLGHAIRTALYTASGNVEMIKKNAGSNDKIISYLTRIKEANDQIISILDNDFSNSSDSIFRQNIDAFDVEYLDSDSVKGKRVLLVEDNEMNREITRDILEDNGFKVESAIDGLSAVSMVDSAAPGYYDCVLMDIQVPGMNGIEAAKHIRSLSNRVRAGVPIIAMTASAFEGDKEKCLRAGMDAYLTKPVDSVRLIKTMVRFL